MAEHALMSTILTQRRHHLQHLLALYPPTSPPPPPRPAVAALVAINDLAVAVDFLSSHLPPSPTFHSSPLLTLETSALLLPMLRLLLQSRFEGYVALGLRYMALILQAFAGVIRGGRGGGAGGVDVVGEERRERCEVCWRELKGAERTIEGLRAKTGGVGTAAREVAALMAGLEG